jgi:hypothetical protein
LAKKGIRRFEMKKFLLILLLILISASIVMADSYESITVAGTSIGLTTATYGRATWGICRVETAEIRYTMDGATTPTDAIGVLLEPFEWVILNNPDQLRNFRAIRTTGTSGYLKCHYFQR